MKSFFKIFTILIFPFTVIYSQQVDLKFHHLSVNDGLSQVAANSILQDKNGFMWFGTQDGLNRYDGYTFKIFTHQYGKKNSLSNSYIWSVFQDDEGIMWIGSFGGGLTKFDPADESYIHFKRNEKDKNSLSSNDIFNIFEFPKGTLWLRTGNGINKFDKATKKVIRYLEVQGNKNEAGSNYIGALAAQGDFIWAGTDSGLARLNIISGENKYFTSDPMNGKLKFGVIHDLLFDKEELLVCCDSGLIKLNFKLNTAIRILVSPVTENKGAAIGKILPDGNFYWLGTNNGLLLYDKTTNKLNHYLNNPDKPYSLSHNNIISLFKSRDGIIWVGTYGGLNKVDKIQEDFALLHYDPTLKNTLSQKSIGPVIEDKKGILWIGTPDGLNAYNRLNNENIIFTNSPGKSTTLSSSYILSLYEDRKGNIWVGTRGGGVNKFRYNDISGIRKITFERIMTNHPVLSRNRIQSIFEDSKGILWFGTGGRGLLRYNPETKDTKSYPPSNDGTGLSHTYVYCIYEDSKGNFWLGTPTGGLNMLDRKNERFLYIRKDDENIKSLSNDIILTIFEDSKNNLWIGTSGGLNRLDSRLEENMFQKINDSLITLSFTRYGRPDGLPNEVIYGILEDAENNLWVSTNNGLVKINPATEEPVVKIFDVSHGLQNNEFNQNSFYKNIKGEMYFGGVSGLNIFHPDSIKENPHIPPVVITDFLLYNEPVPLINTSNGKSFTLSKTINFLNKLELDYDHDFISFEFAALNFINTEKNLYAYMLEGFDKDWIYAGNKRFATYTNLDPGTYVFRVKGSNNDGIWNEQGASIKLFIPPPPWLSWYAYLIYSCLFISSVFLLIRYRVRAATRELEVQAKIEQAKIQEREEVRRKSSADFHDEAGNKLTKISLFTELARNAADHDPSILEYLHKIEENTKELSSGMRDFIWVLDPARDSLIDTINRLKDFGNSMFSYTEINFSLKEMTKEIEKIILPMESRRALLLIFKEAMNNCLKYSEARNAELEVNFNSDHLRITFKDDGKGFDKTGSSDGYGMNNMSERAKKIKADFELISSEGSGTKITLSFNIPHLSN